MSEPGVTGEYLVVAVGDSFFGLAAALVESAVAPPAVTPLPFVPPFVEGLVSVNDRIVPLIDLRALLLPGQTVPAQSELVVVETSRSPCALRVDRIVATVVADVDESAAFAAEEDAAAADARLVKSRFTSEGSTVLVLDGDVLGSLVSAGDVAPGRRGLLGRQQRETEEAVAQTESCVVVGCAGELYGIALADAVEILDIGPASPLPGAPALVEGMALVRGQVLLVLSLSALLGRSGAAVSRNVVVVEQDGRSYGLRVDGVEGILAWTAEGFHPIDTEGSELAGVIVDGERAIGLIGISRLLSAARRRVLAPFMPARAVESQAVAEATRALLEVSLAGEMLGIPLASVRRIARYSNSLELESADGERLRGAVNLDGSILPVLDLRADLGVDEIVVTARGAWIVVGEGDQEWAVAVEEARRIVDVPDSAVEMLGDASGRLVNAVARVDARLLSLLDVAAIRGAA